MRHSLLLKSVSAVLHVGSQWIYSRDCTGYPQSLQVFDVNDPRYPVRTANDTWPSMYGVFAPVYPYDFCGAAFGSILPKQCCTNNLLPSYTEGYQSAIMVEVLQESKLEEYASAEANGGKYCHLVPLTSTDVFGYKELYLLNDGSCAESQLRCFSNGTIAAYMLPGCEGEVELIDLGSGEPVYSSAILGSFGGSMITFSKGKALIGWVEILPGVLAVPQFYTAWDYFAAIGFAWSIGAFIYSFYYAVQRFRKQRTPIMTVLMVSNLLLLIWICFRIALVYTVFPHSSAMFVVTDGEGISINLASLAVCFYSAMFLSALQEMSKMWSIGMYVSIVLVHFLFAGQYYFFPFFPPRFGTFTFAWENNLRYLWFVVWFLWDTVPILVGAWKIMRCAKAITLWERIRETYKRDKLFFFGALLQIMVSAMYFIIRLIQNTNILGSDDVLTAFGCYRTAMIATHAIFNTFMVERLKILMASVVAPKAFKLQSVDELASSNYLTTGGDTAPMPKSSLWEKETAFQASTMPPQKGA